MDRSSPSPTPIMVAWLRCTPQYRDSRDSGFHSPVLESTNTFTFLILRWLLLRPALGVGASPPLLA
jgi:hypothetical protein